MTDEALLLRPGQALKHIASIRFIRLDLVEQSLKPKIESYIRRCRQHRDIHSNEFERDFELKFARLFIEEVQKDLFIKANESLCCLGSCFSLSVNCHDGLYFCRNHDIIGKIHGQRHNQVYNRLVFLCLIKDLSGFDHVKCAKDAILVAFAQVYRCALDILIDCRRQRQFANDFYSERN